MLTRIDAFNDDAQEPEPMPRPAAAPTPTEADPQAAPSLTSGAMAPVDEPTPRPAGRQLVGHLELDSTGDHVVFEPARPGDAAEIENDDDDQAMPVPHPAEYDESPHESTGSSHYDPEDAPRPAADTRSGGTSSSWWDKLKGKDGGQRQRPGKIARSRIARPAAAPKTTKGQSIWKALRRRGGRR